MKSWSVAVLCAILGILVLFGGLVAIIDPFFLWHKPILENGYALEASRELYYSPGILRHFDYEAAIIGTSMTENSDPADVERLFGWETVKAPMSGGQPADFAAYLKLLRRGTKAVFWGLDMNSWVTTPPGRYRDGKRPEYLYNANPFDDIEYALGVGAIERALGTVKRAIKGEPSAAMSEYAYWAGGYEFSKAGTLGNYERPPLAESAAPPGAYLPNATEQFEVNIKPALEANPGTDFYLFAPPTSMLYWDLFLREGKADALLNAYFELIRLCLEYENARFFWFDYHALITDLDNYKDQSHYGPEWNTWMFERMSEGGYELTRDNIVAAKERFAGFIKSFDYEAYF
ncbi:hypothetical protein FACS1894202_03290 [Clostridia bacterium]|nr:hypothetical protein FACS1894202_03290 [Clostridia bacterium]